MFADIPSQGYLGLRGSPPVTLLGGLPDVVTCFVVGWLILFVLTVLESDADGEVEVEATAEAIAASGKVVEVNTGAISRGWLDDAYPSASFRDLLRVKGVKFLLSSDAHAADAIDCAFDRFGDAEEYLSAPPVLACRGPRDSV